MSSNFKSVTKEQVTLTFLLDLLKYFKLTYNLFPELKKKELIIFKKEILRIVNDLR